jgi:hypothetical protein
MESLFPAVSITMTFFKKLLSDFNLTEAKPTPPPPPPKSVKVERQKGWKVYFVNGKYIFQLENQGFLIRSLSGLPIYYLLKGYIIKEKIFEQYEWPDKTPNTFRIPFEKVEFVISPGSDYCYDGEYRYYYDEAGEESGTSGLPPESKS